MTATINPELESPARAAQTEPVLAAIIAEFPSAAAVLSAAKKIRAGGWTQWDVHSPFPIHGIDDVIGIRATRLPWITLVAGCTGVMAGLVMQWWMNAVDYPFLISGKPLFGLPAAIPVTFELMILFAAISTLLGMLLLNGLPRFSNPLFQSDRFLRVTSDRFFICISAGDPQFDRDAVEQALRDCHATGIDECFAPASREYRIPGLLKSAVVVLAVLALIPPVLIAQKRSTSSTEPRFHAIADMDFQPKFKPQRTSTLFADGRAMRPQPAGTVARGDLRDDSRLYQGLEPVRSNLQAVRTVSLKMNADDGKAGKDPGAPVDPLDAMPWVTRFPIAVTQKAMNRGQERYNIYCAVCHGLAGDGDGLVTRRAMELEQGTWIKPISFHTDNLRSQPVGRMFNSISNGVRKMPSYADLIPVEDRWCILLYVRALQQSRTAQVQNVPAELIPQLRDLPRE